MNAKRIFIDLETYRTRNQAVIDQIRREQRARVPAQNKSKEEKLMWNTPEGIESRVNEALAKTSVDPLFAEILCIAIAMDEGEPEAIDCMNHSESCGLGWFGDWIEENCDPNTIWVGHNLQNFDLAILLNRCRALGIHPPTLFPTFRGRYWDGRVWDTMLRTPCANGLGLVKLEDVCLAYGISTPKGRVCLEDGTPLEGSTVGLAYERGEFDAICSYAKEDIIATRELYNVQSFGQTRDTWEAEDRDLTVIYKIRDCDDIPSNDKAALILQALVTLGRVSRDVLPKAVTA